MDHNGQAGLSQLDRPRASTLVDVQNEIDHRYIAIDEVGIADIKYPVVVADKEGIRQHTIATIAMSVNLAHHLKGTHMSRFVEALSSQNREFSVLTVHAILDDIKGRLFAERARISVHFPFFRERIAPVTGSRALMDYQCSLTASSSKVGTETVLGVSVPVASLCPCSKAISDYGAHNQRGTVSIEVSGRRDPTGIPSPIWIEELIDFAESSSSSPLYPVLKRADERHVTMQAYDNPVFVEDIVRGVSARLKSEERVMWFRVRVVNQESIHNHNAYALVEWSRSGAMQ